jgi:hypothetical protein
MNRTVVATIAALTLPLAAQSDSASAARTHYFPKHHRCASGYVRKTIKVRKHRHGKIVRVSRVECVRRAASKPKPSAPLPTPALTPAPATGNTTPAQQPAVHYAARVDPSFTQAPGNPLSVTYAYSADATSVVNGVSTDLASVGQLPAGILNFYSQQSAGGPQSLYCSMNVGGTTTGGGCPITYSDTGTYLVTTQYIPSAASAVTETDSETIKPYPTTASLTVAYLTPYTNVGPPPTYLTTEHQPVLVTVNSSDPANAGITLTITDQTTGASLTCPPQAGNAQGIDFGTNVNDGQAPPFSVGCGYQGMPIATTDTLTVSAATTGSAGYLPSTSASYPLWPSP